jgi:hypothetical protein
MCNYCWDSAAVPQQVTLPGLAQTGSAKYQYINRLRLKSVQDCPKASENWCGRSPPQRQNAGNIAKMEEYHSNRD